MTKFNPMYFIFQPGLEDKCLCQQGLTCTSTFNASAVSRCLEIPASPRERDDEV